MPNTHLHFKLHKGKDGEDGRHAFEPAFAYIIADLPNVYSVASGAEIPIQTSYALVNIAKVGNGLKLPKGFYQVGFTVYVQPNQHGKFCLRYGALDARFSNALFETKDEAQSFSGSCIIGVEHDDTTLVLKNASDTAISLGQTASGTQNIATMWAVKIKDYS